jgi:integrase/recombinase XerC
VFIRQWEMSELIEDEKEQLQHDANETEGLSFEEVRNNLIILMFYSTGMRRAELISLRDANVDTTRSELKVLGKRNKERIIPFGKELADAITLYRDVRRQQTGGLLHPSGR